MTEAEIEQVREWCRQVLRAFPGAVITVRDRKPAPHGSEREAA